MEESKTGKMGRKGPLVSAEDVPFIPLSPGKIQNPVIKSILSFVYRKFLRISVGHASNRRATMDGRSRGSFWMRWGVPALLFFLLAVLIGLIGVAIGIAIGWIPWA